MAASLTFQDGQAKVSKRVEKELHNTKVVVRRLPPDMTEDKLFELFTDIPEYNFFYLAAGDPTFGELATSRAYFSFMGESSIIPFRDKYDGLPIESDKGQKYRAVIEFAPCQSIPKRLKKKADSRLATIEQDQDYLGFAEIAHFKKEPPTMADIAAYVDTLAANKVQEVQMTPLLSYVMDNHRRGGRSSKRSKAASGESKKKRSKESKTTKESRSKNEDGSKTGSGGTKEWGGKSRKERAGKKLDIDTAPSISPTSVEGKGASGSSEKITDKGKWREEGKGKGWKEGSRGWRDDGAWEGGSEPDRREGEGTREGKKEKLGSKGVRRSGEGSGRDEDQGGDRGMYKEKRSTKKSNDERKPKASGVRNKDRPDQAIYSARGRSRGGGEFNHAYSKDRDGSYEGRKTKEKSESSHVQSGRSDEWRRRDQMNGENPKFYGYGEDYGGGEAKGRSGGSRRGKRRDAAHSESTSGYDK